jgi:CrcB protein
MAALGQRVVPSEPMRLAIGVGFLGAYTTFSTWMYDCDAMMREGIPMRAMLNLIGSVVLGLLAVRAGFWLAPR